MERSLTWLDARRLRWPAVGLSVLLGLKLLAVSAAAGRLAWVDLPPVLLLGCAFGIGRRSALAAKWALGLSVYAAVVNGIAALAAITGVPNPMSLTAGPASPPDPCLAVPMSATAVFGLAIAIRLRSALRRAFFANPNVCLACGYDVRASTGRCPECGHAIDRDRLWDGPPLPLQG